MSLRELMQEIDTTYGAGTAAQGSHGGAFKLSRFQTGIFDLDAAIGGGWPWGKTFLVYGPQSGGKSAIVYKASAGAQRCCRYCRTVIEIDRNGERQCACPKECPDCSKQYEPTKYSGPDYQEGDLFNWKAIHDEWTCSCLVEGETKKKSDRVRKVVRRCGGCRVALVDVEFNYDSDWGQILGLDNDALFVMVPEYAEQAIDISDKLLRSGEIDILAVDSLAELVPSKEIEASVTGDSRILVRDSKTGEVRHAAIEEVFESCDAVADADHRKPLAGLETMAFKEGVFDWAPVSKVWKPKRQPEHRLLKVTTKYGRELKLTSCHSVYRLRLENARRDPERRMQVYDGVPELVEGADLRTGDWLLLCEPGERLGVRAAPIDLAGYQVLESSPYNRCHFASPELLPLIAEDGRCAGQRYLYRDGVHGPHMPLTWLPRQELGDGRLYYTGAPAYAQRFIPSENLAYTLGIFLGDGYTNQGQIIIYAGKTNHEEVHARICADLEPYISPRPRLTPRNKEEGADWIIRIGCRPLGLMFEHHFADASARTKSLPDFVWTWPEQARRSLVEGLVDSDGHLREQGCATISTSSKRLAEDIVMLLATMGATASVNARTAPPTMLKGRPVIPNGPNYMVSFSWAAFCGNNEGHSGRRQSGVLVPDGVPVQIQGIAEIPWEDVYDMEVADAHTFVANGVLVHNSTEEWQIGLQARLINKMMRKVSSALNSYGVASANRPSVFLINQTRESMHGETIPGGKHQLFRSTITLRVNSAKYKFKSEGKDEEKVTEILYADVSGFTKKNKSFTPQRTFSTRLYMAPTGEHPAGSTNEVGVVLDRALEYEIVGRPSAALYEYEKRSWKTQKAILEDLQADREFFNGLRTQTMVKALEAVR